MTWRLALVLTCLAWGALGGEPVFDPTTLMRLVLVPADAAVGSVIYRVRASDPDFDYPLHFELIGQMGRLDVGVETLPCTRYNSVCQANVILLRRLEPGRYVDFRLSVRNTRGRSSRIACSITGTNATTPRDTIFPHQPPIVLVPEVCRYDFKLSVRNTRGHSSRITRSITGTNATTPKDSIFGGPATSRCLTVIFKPEVTAAHASHPSVNRSGRPRRNHSKEHHRNQSFSLRQASSSPEPPSGATFNLKKLNEAQILRS